jgi:hypothetical protein
MKTVLTLTADLTLLHHGVASFLRRQAALFVYFFLDIVRRPAAHAVTFPYDHTYSCQATQPFPKRAQ